MNKKLAIYLIIGSSCLLILPAILGIIFINPKESVPDVSGKSLAVASEMLEENGFEFDFVTEKNNTVPKDCVISQETKAGTKLKKGSTIVLKISEGPELVLVPYVQNTTAEEAEKTLTDLGFKVTISYGHSKSYESGKVISQSIYSGYEVEYGSEIEIVVSQGADLVKMPNVVGKTLDAATSELYNAGLKVNADIKCSNKVKEGLIISQEVASGSMVGRNSKVTLYVSAGKSNTVGNSNANLQQEGYVTSQGNWVYFVNFGGNYCLYKMKHDGTEKQLISTDNACALNVVGEWIYYYSQNDNAICKIKLNGTEKTKLYSGSYYYIFVQGDWIYFAKHSSDSTIHRIKTDGSGKMTVCNEECSNINIIGDWIYYTNAYDDLVYKIRTNGSDKSLVNNNFKWYELLVHNNALYTKTGYGFEKINIDNTSYESFLYESQKQKLYMNINNNFLYYYQCDYTKSQDKYSLCKYDLNSHQATELFDLTKTGASVSSIHIVGDWLYFTSHAQNTVCFYRVKTDGTSYQKITL